MKKCVNISILDFKLFREEEDFHSCFHLREDTRHTLYTDKIEFHILELPKLPPELKENSSDRLLWAKFINAERKEELEMIANQNSYIGSAYEQLETISQDKQKRLEYEAREKAIRDHNQGIFEAVLRGKKEGIEEGRKEGREEERLEKIFTTISILLELNTEHQIIIEKLESKYQLPAEKAKEYIHQVMENPVN